MTARAPIVNPCRGPGWTRAVTTYVVSYRDPTSAERRRRLTAPVPLHARRAVYVAPWGDLYPAAKVDLLVASLPRGRGVDVRVDWLDQALGRVLSVAWASPWRNGRVRLLPCQDAARAAQLADVRRVRRVLTGCEP